MDKQSYQHVIHTQTSTEPPLWHKINNYLYRAPHDTDVMKNGVEAEVYIPLHKVAWYQRGASTGLISQKPLNQMNRKKFEPN